MRELLLRAGVFSREFSMLLDPSFVGIFCMLYRRAEDDLRVYMYEGR